MRTMVRARRVSQKDGPGDVGAEELRRSPVLHDLRARKEIAKEEPKEKSC